MGKSEKIPPVSVGSLCARSWGVVDGDLLVFERESPTCYTVRKLDVGEPLDIAGVHRVRIFHEEE